MLRFERIVTCGIITILIVWNLFFIYKIDVLENRLKQKEYQIKVRETRANQKVREAEQVIKDNTIYLEDIN